MRMSLNGSGAAIFSGSVTARGPKSQIIADGNSVGAGILLSNSIVGVNRRNWGIFTEQDVEGDFVIKRSTVSGGDAQSGTTVLSLSRDGAATLTGALSGTSATFSGDLSIVTSTSAILNIQGNSGNSKNIFFKSTGAADNSIRLYQDGGTNNFIIATGDGTTAPTNRFTIASTGAATFSSSVTMAYGGTPRLTLQDTDGGAGNVGILFKESTNDKWTLASVGGAFQFFNEATASNALYITASNNVGIGTSTIPNQNGGTLAGSTIVNGIMRIQGANGRYFTSGDGMEISKGSIYSYNRDSGFYNDIAINDTMIVKGGNSNVLIGRSTSGLNNTVGTTLTGGTIQIEENAYVFYGNRTASDGLFMGIRRNNVDVGSITVTTSSTAFNTSSDYRLKQDLKEFNGLSIINSIKTYDYEWKIDNTRAYGVIAHELEEILPYAVFGKKDEINENGNIKPQAVDYSKIVPLLINAIQELKQEIDILKNK
jgi:hypothetical protein